MKSQIYRIVRPINFLFRFKYSHRPRVLAYHKVPDKTAFEKQVSYLNANYNIIGIKDLLLHFERNKKLPKNPLLITFDDGDVSVLENGLPILKKYNLKSCLFIITALVNTTEAVWIKRVEAKEMEEGKSYLEARQRVNEMKQMDNAARIEQMKKYPGVHQPQLSSNDLGKMQNDGMFIGNHTHTHPMLDKCSPAEIQQELNQAEKVFRSLNLKGFNIFAYPNGNTNDETEAILRNHGMKLVFLFDHRINEREIDPLKISRIMVDADTEINEFKSKVSGVHPFFFHLKTMITA